ncbi:MAG: ABC transporter ATP-binding protein [Lentisphaeria bacterium]
MTTRQKYFHLLKTCIKPRRRLFGLTLLAVLAFNTVELVLPKLLQLYVDSFAGNELAIFGVSLEFAGSAMGQLLILPALLLAVAGLRWTFTYARTVLQTRLAQGALFDLRSRIFNTMQNLSFAYHDNAHSGRIIANIVEDVNYARRFFQFGLFPLLESVLYLIGALLVMAFVCPPAGLVSAALLGLAAIGVTAYFKYGYKFFVRTKEIFTGMVQIFSENMEGYLVVKAFGCEDGQQQTYHRQVEDLQRATFREIMVSTAMNQALAWAGILGIAAVVGVSIYAGQQGGWDFTAGKLFFLFYLQRSMVVRIRMLGRSMDLSIRFTVTADRLGALFRADQYLDSGGRQRLPDSGPGRIEARSVSFAYGDRSHSLKDISLRIAAGQTVGLVGSTGSGKSTLALLLCRFYDPDRGVILLDGRDIREYNLGDVRNQFSLVFQDNFLFSAPVWQNIAYGKPGATYEDIIHAASIAQAHEFIQEMPNGYETVVGERGVTLSGGQRQRLSIARAVLRKPRFLVLDACTSAVDAMTENAIQNSLNALRETSTVIVIAQRYSSVADADQVYVLNEGMIIESGSPNELNQPGTAFSRVLHITEPIEK